MSKRNIRKNLPGTPVKTSGPLLKQLEESQERLSAALSCARIGVFDWNITTNRVIYMSHRAMTPDERIAIQEVDASHWLATTHPEDIARARGAVDRAVRGESDGFSMRYRALREGAKPGEWIVVHSRGRVHARDNNGRATRILGIFEDITHLAAREEQDRQRDARLTRATQIAALGELASSLAHEINQPLATLSAYLQAGVQTARRKNISRPELITMLQRCEQQAQRAGEIVSRLKNLYRDRQLAEENVDLPGCVNEVFSLLNREIEEHRIRVKKCFCAGKLSLRGDRLQIEQVLYNLVRNALDALHYYGNGRCEITVTVQRRTGRIRIRIADNGPGIPENIRSRLFEPFFTTKPTGTGLGLSISRTIIEAHRGRIVVDARVRRGAAFMIELPAGDRKP
ncbi:MAG TPA: ATP-binding protein [Kiritimatiellia bacterium]|nr:ATP-binding protein [Kiritimatiellia bacterium]HMP00380.1 ATP-binding protein [Kiritimatiellia bacterium]